MVPEKDQRKQQPDRRASFGRRPEDCIELTQDRGMSMLNAVLTICGIVGVIASVFFWRLSIAENSMSKQYADLATEVYSIRDLYVNPQGYASLVERVDKIEARAAVLESANTEIKVQLAAIKEYARGTDEKVSLILAEMGIGTKRQREVQ